MRPKRLISLLVAVCMMITMLPLSAVTAFAADTAASTGTASYGGYKYDYNYFDKSDRVTGDRQNRIIGCALAEIISDAGAFVLPFFWNHPGDIRLSY